MEMNPMMNVIGGVWESLDKMHRSNPEEYKKIVDESVKWQSNVNSKPEPCKCVEAKTETGVKCYVNLMTWTAIAQPDFTSNLPSLPIAGGVQTLTIGHSVFSVCIHPSVLKNSDNSDIEDDELDNIVKLIFKFLHQIHPGLKLDEKDYKVLTEKSLMGNGVEICEKLLKLRGPGAGGNIKGESSLVTGNTTSLISQLGTMCQEDKPEGDSDRISLYSPLSQDLSGRKPLIQEIGKSETKKKSKVGGNSSFGANLQKAFNSSKKDKTENCDNIKTRIEETFLKEVKSKRY